MFTLKGLLILNSSSVLFTENNWTSEAHVTDRDLQRMWHNEKFQAPSWKGINDKCHEHEDGMADWHGSRDEWETAGGKRTKSIDDVSKRTRVVPGLMWRMIGEGRTCCTCKLIKHSCNCRVKKRRFEGTMTGRGTATSRADTMWWNCTNHCFLGRKRSITTRREDQLRRKAS